MIGSPRFSTTMNLRLISFIPSKELPISLLKLLEYREQSVYRSFSWTRRPYTSLITGSLIRSIRFMQVELPFEVRPYHITVDRISNE